MATKIQDFSPNFLNNQLLNILLQILATEPTAIQGKIFLDSAESAVKVSLDGVDWTTLATLDDLASAGVSLEQVIDSLGTTVLTEGSNISITYDDAANSGTGGITIDVTGLGSAAFTSSGDYDVAGSAASAQAFAIQRANHTGTQTVATLSDFNTSVQSLLDAEIASLVDSAPGTLDTLNEIAAALGDDPNFATTITTALAARTQRYVTLYGDGAASTFNINHGLGTTTPIVGIVEVASGDTWGVPWSVADANNITITHTITPSSDQFRVAVVGKTD